MLIGSTLGRIAVTRARAEAVIGQLDSRLKSSERELRTGAADRDRTAATQSCEVHSHIRCALDTYRCFLCARLGPYAHLPPLMRTSKSTLDLEVNHAVACVRIA